MRVVLFGAGSPLSLSCLQALESEGLVAVAVPHPPMRMSFRALRRALAHRRGTRSLIDTARRKNITIVPFDPRDSGTTAEALTRIGADLFCIGAFPYLLQSRLLSLPQIGTLNVHFSLLPRHRGPSPLPETYLDDDRITGLTIHWVTEEADAGDIAAREELPLARGRLVDDLYRDLCLRATPLLRNTVRELASGHGKRLAQPEIVDEHDQVIDPCTWPAERVWHVLSGLGDRFGPLLCDRGRALPHGHATNLSLVRSGPRPGTIERTRAGYRIHCVDGSVDVERRSIRYRLHQSLRRFFP